MKGCAVENFAKVTSDLGHNDEPNLTEQIGPKKDVSSKT